MQPQQGQHLLEGLPVGAPQCLPRAASTGKDGTAAAIVPVKVKGLQSWSLCCLL